MYGSKFSLDFTLDLDSASAGRAKLSRSFLACRAIRELRTFGRVSIRLANACQIASAPASILWRRDGDATRRFTELKTTSYWSNSKLLIIEPTCRDIAGHIGRENPFCDSVWDLVAWRTKTWLKTMRWNTHGEARTASKGKERGETSRRKRTN